MEEFKRNWTPEMIAQLRWFKAEHKSVREIMAAMGLSKGTVNKAWSRYRPGSSIGPPPGASETVEPRRTITLGVIAERYDTRAAILREVAKIPAGEFMEQGLLSRIAVGADHVRFNRCLELNAGEFGAYRIKIKIGESPEGKWFWAAPADIAKAREEIEQYL